MDSLVTCDFLFSWYKIIIKKNNSISITSHSKTISSQYSNYSRFILLVFVDANSRKQSMTFRRRGLDVFAMLRTQRVLLACCNCLMAYRIRQRIYTSELIHVPANKTSVEAIIIDRLIHTNATAAAAAAANHRLLLRSDALKRMLLLLHRAIHLPYYVNTCAFSVYKRRCRGNGCVAVATADAESRSNS